jgi:putative addiction module CopG family antidote
MEVHLPRELEEFLRDLVASGRYPSASEALAASLFLLQDREYVRSGRLEWLRNAVQEGIDSLEKLRKTSPTKAARKPRRRAG